MHDKGKILLGLVIFFGILSFPFWFTVASGNAGYAPHDTEEFKAELEKAKARAVALGKGEECVLETQEMIPKHMELLNAWRDEAVREGGRTHVREMDDGKKYEYDKSLTRTCLDCHSNKSQFCNQCHDYLGVDPFCWDCHVDPMEVE